MSLCVLSRVVHWSIEVPSPYIPSSTPHMMYTQSVSAEVFRPFRNLPRFLLLATPGGRGVGTFEEDGHVRGDRKGRSQTVPR